VYWRKDRHFLFVDGNLPQQTLLYFQPMRHSSYREMLLGRRTTLAAVLLLLVVSARAKQNQTWWIYDRCETGSVDVPLSDEVFVWLYLLEEFEDEFLTTTTTWDERVVKASAVPDWAHNRTLICQESILANTENNMTLYTQGEQVYDCQQSQQALELCETLERLTVRCSYDHQGVLSDGGCRYETNADSCVLDILQEDSSFSVIVSLYPPLQVSYANGGLEDANATVSVGRGGDLENLIPLSSWPNSTTLTAGNTGLPYTLYFENPRFGHAYVLATTESVIEQSIVNQYYLTRVQGTPFPTSQFSVPLSWTGRVTYQAVFISDEEQCQFYTSDLFEFVVDAPWYAEESTFDECKLCAVSDIGRSTDGSGTLLHEVEEGGYNYTHSCDSLFVAGTRGQISVNQCSVVQEYECCAPVSSSRAACLAASVGLLLVIFLF